MKPAKDSSRSCAGSRSQREIEKALPLEDRLYARLMRAWSNDRARAEQYLGSLIGTQRRIVAQEGFLTRLPLPLAQIGRHLVREAEARRAENRRKTQMAVALAEAEQATRQAAAEASLLEQFASLPSTERIRALAALDPEERDRIASGEERQAILDLRRRALTTSQVREALGCSLPEINRWSADGRLPHLFSRQIRVHRLVTARFWNADDVRSAAEHVANWRERDRVRHAYRRSGLRPVHSVV